MLLRMPPARRIRPTREELAAAHGAVLPDLVGAGLRLLLVGINPGLWSGAVGRHFGNPSNRLWPVLHGAGFTDRRLHPDEADELLARGIGVTNLVARTTATAAELSDEEVRAGVAPLEEKIARWRPEIVAFLGLSTYRVAYRRPKATIGPQDHHIAGVPVWLLPNPSGLNAHYQLPDLVREYRRLRAALDPPAGPRRSPST